MNKVFAAETRLGTLKGVGPLAEFDLYLGVGPALAKFQNVLSNIIGIMTIIAGLWFIFQFIIGAFSYLTSGGDKAKTEEARQKITTALIGLVIVIAAIFIIDLIGKLLGLEILRPGEFIIDMWS